MKTLKWIDKNFEAFILTVLLILMTLIMGIQIVFRFVFNNSLSWTEELTRYLFVWSGFLSIAFAVEKGISIKVDMITLKMKKKVKSIVKIIDNIIEIIFFGYMIPFAWEIVYDSYLDKQLSPACSIPIWIIKSSALIGFILCEVRLVEDIFKQVRIIQQNKEDADGSI
ncbi:MAG: TRAP transporter small permease [Lachnospiraceae bacterium]|jgi:TRAP-type C4-dicarboxylate transport system permease small subunit|nr:TRAP transporter small permease [Lachnospiraceae bacterium]